MASTRIEAGSLPSYANFEKTELDNIFFNQSNYPEIPVKDLHTPVGNDPTNWFIFDVGDSEVVTNPTTTPRWLGWKNSSNVVIPLCSSPYANSTFWYQTWYNSTNSAPYTSNGPRNLGYLEVGPKTFIKINNGISNAESVLPQMISNIAWKNAGAIEFTIKPAKSNCTILSGAFAKLTQLVTTQVNDGMGSTQIVENPSPSFIGTSAETAMFDGFSLWQSSTGAAKFISADFEQGLSLTANDTDVIRFKIDIIDGKIAIVYDVLDGPEQKSIKIVGTSNVNNGSWHHVVINRPSSFTKKEGDLPYGGTGCIEIWVDGQLEIRSYEIDENTLLTTPHILFNDIWNNGIRHGVALVDTLNTQNTQKTITTGWILDEIEKSGYNGGIRDFIFRQYFALSPSDIKLNYLYAMKNTEGTHIIKAETSKANANIVQPTVSVNKKNVLKLYWNNLLNDKNKTLDGLELDESYNVYSYSMTNKNIINPTQTFNLDLNQNTTRKYLENVKTVCKNFVFIFMPNGLMVSENELPNNRFEIGTTGKVQQQNLYDNQSILLNGIAGQWHVNNLLFGGVNVAVGEKILLTNQHNSNENGVWIYNGGDKPLTRPIDINASDLNLAHVYITDGDFADTTWVQINEVAHIRKSSQKWIQIDNEASLSTSNSYPIHTTPWSDSNGSQRFIDVINDVNINYDVICFMNYPTESSEINNSFATLNNSKTRDAYNVFLTTLKTAVSSGKSLYVSSPMLAIDLGIVDKATYVDQVLGVGDAQSAAISPFEYQESSENYFDTHRNNKYQVVATLSGLTNKPNYIMTDFVAYSPENTNSDYHIKYTYRSNGLLTGDEFIIPGTTLLPETLNEQLPGYISNQKATKPLPVFHPNDINQGTVITKLANNIYNGSTSIANPYHNYASTIAVVLGSGKMFVNCVENTYAFSRSDYNKGRIQNFTVGQNGETTSTAVWQYSTSRINKKNLYDFSETTNAIGQTTPTNGGGGPIVQAQSHASNGLIRKLTNQDDIKYQSDLYPDFTEEFFSTTEIPVLSMTWLGLKWLAGE